MLYKTKYEKQLKLIKLNEEIIRSIRKYNKLLSDKTEIKKNNLKIKFYEAQTKIFRQKAKKLNNTPEGNEIGEILSNNNFGMSGEDLIEKAFKERIEEIHKQNIYIKKGDSTND